MSAAELTLDQLRDAIVRLPEPERRQLLSTIQTPPDPEVVRSAANTMRAARQWPAEKQARLSQLLAKGGEGDLSAGENEELNALVDEFESQTLSMAEELAESLGVCIPSPTART